VTEYQQPVLLLSYKEAGSGRSFKTKKWQRNAGAIITTQNISKIKK